MSQEMAEGSERRKRYTEEFKRSVIDHWQSSGKAGAEIAKEFGIPLWTLRDWKRKYNEVAKPVDAPVPQTREQMSREIQQLRRELARVTMQRDILKKTMGILSES